MQVRVPDEAEVVFRRLPGAVRDRLHSELKAMAELFVTTPAVESPQRVHHAGFDAEFSVSAGELVVGAIRARPGTPSVLVVEDDDDVRASVCGVLEEAGYAPLEAQHGADALSLLEHGTRPSLILLDLAMPVMDGRQLLERLGRDAALRDLPVVVMSGSGERPPLVRNFLSKPFELSRLLEVVRAECGPSPAKTPDFRLLFESSPGLYLALTPDLTIVAASDAYLRATMTQREEIVGRCLFDVFPDNPNDPSADGVRTVRASLDRVLRLRAPDAMALQRYAIRRPPAEGGGFEERWWSAINAPIFGPDRRIAFIIHRVEDVTEFVRLKQQGAADQRAAEEFKSRAEKMEAEIYARGRELDDARRRSELEQLLIGIVSHDLRNPIQAIVLGGATLLRRNALNERQRETINKLLGAADRAMRMVRDLLDFTQARVGGGIPVNLAEADLHELAQQVVEEIQVSRTDHTFLVDAKGDGTGVWDADRISQLLSNLVSNAATYSPPGSTVRVWTWGEGDSVWIRVHNAGDPFPPELLQAPFRPLNRGGSKTRANRSIGLGLYITHAIVEAHGGRIEVSSTHADGTTFVVELPRRR